MDLKRLADIVTGIKALKSDDSKRVVLAMGYKLSLDKLGEEAIRRAEAIENASGASARRDRASG